MRPVPRRLTAVACAIALSAGLLAVSDGPQAKAEPPVTTTATKATAKKSAKTAKTSKLEKRRSKRVKTPRLKWYTCYDYAKCATVKVPRDYDKPKGKKVEIAVLKVPAKNQKKKIGTLFVNPGGPGGWGTEMAYFSGELLSPSVTNRFDVVGFDPRGIGFSDNVACFDSARQRENEKIVESWYAGFPYGAKQEKAARKIWDKEAKGCSTTGKPLTGAVSTAEVARDMDVLRRAVGDKKLSYLGFSYGSYLGEVYANLYPDRVRAIAIDGVLDPVQWAGTTKTAGDPVGDRVRSADGGSRALRQLLKKCDLAGPTKCSFAAGNPVARYEKIAQRLRKGPLVEVDEDGERYVTTYTDFVGITQDLLTYSDYAVDYVADYAAALWAVLNGTDSTTAGTAAKRAAVSRLKQFEAAIEKAKQPQRIPGRAYGFPYDSSLDSYLSVICTDSRNTKNLKKFATIAKAADRRAPYFGRLWLWDSAGCSSTKWRVKDEDAYRGPFTKRTSSPVLIVGNYWDPSTNYRGAVSTAKRMPNSRLLLSNSWGHTAYGVSSCVTKAMDRYLLSRKLPAEGTVCQGAYQPFTEVLSSDSTAKKSSIRLEPKLVGGGPGRLMGR